MRFSSKWLKLAIGIVCIVVVVVVLLAPPSFRGVKRIVLEGGRKHTTVVVDKPEEVREMLGTLRLWPKPPCMCKHGWSARFEKEGSAIEVSFCDHCFDVMNGDNRRMFGMPKGFLKLVEEHVGGSLY